MSPSAIKICELAAAASAIAACVAAAAQSNYRTAFWAAMTLLWIFIAVMRRSTYELRDDFYKSAERARRNG